MLKIGLFTFGGGYAMIALLENEFIAKRHWIEQDEFLDMTAIAESTPGPIAINSATYIGYKMAGVPGSVAATLGVCIPSFVIIYIISLFFDAFLAISVVAHAFRGIQVCVVYLILSAGIKMLRNVKKNAFSLSILTAVIVLMLAVSLFSVKFSSVFFILASGAAGVCAYLIRRIRKNAPTEQADRKGDGKA